MVTDLAGSATCHTCLGASSSVRQYIPGLGRAVVSKSDHCVENVKVALASLSDALLCPVMPSMFLALSATRDTGMRYEARKWGLCRRPSPIHETGEKGLQVLRVHLSGFLHDVVVGRSWGIGRSPVSSIGLSVLRMVSLLIGSNRDEATEGYIP